ncbi:MAG: hypothetical protein ACKO04_06265, partial [Actinomycetes bacterium]
MSTDQPFYGWTRDDLAALVREYLLAGHLIDRAGMPHLIGPYGRDGMADIAIDEWMGASPVYTRRMQQAMGFVGDDVATVFKGMQLDIGAPPQFMDFRYTVHDADHGEFQLAHCGALMDVEPMGEDFVTAMCHHIEDPTFDATALATHAGAQVRPVHRPPRVPADRHPHCHWTLTIDRSVPRRDDPDVTRRLGGSLAAGTVFDAVPPSSDDEADGGWDDYAGPLDPDLRLESFSRSALVVLAREVALQGHLLAMAFMAAVEDRHGHGAAVDVGVRQFAGVAGVVAGRLAALLDAPRSLDGVAQVLRLHPGLAPGGYVDVRVQQTSDSVVVDLLDCPALREDGLDSWAGLLAG